MDLQARIDALQAKNDRLRGRIDQLEAAMGLDYMPPMEWRLTQAEAKVMGCLLAREFCSKDTLMAALYRNDGRDEAEPKIVDVFICKIRKKVSPFGVIIHTSWGQGYYLDQASRATLKEAA
jgi:two-component system, cell cycle response regulator CtrA